MVGVKPAIARASDCRARRDQMVPGSIPGGRIYFTREVLLLHRATLGTLDLRFRSTRSHRGTAPVCSVRCRVSSPGPGDEGVALIH